MQNDNISLSEYQLKELAKCYIDPIYFIENYCWIEVKEQSKIVPAELYDYQKKILAWLIEGNSGLVLKSRRVGGSTVIALYLAWLVNFRRGINALLLSRNEDAAKKLLNKVKFSFFNVRKRTSDDFALAEDASWMLNHVAVNNQQLFGIGWQDAEGNIASTSEVASLTTTSESGRGDSATFVFMDEMAFLPDQEGAARAARLTTTRGGSWVAVSTPNGVGNPFHAWCMRAERRENKHYKFLKVHWSEAGMTSDMIESATEGLTDASRLQEMELQFLSSGDPVFNHVHLAACYRPPEEYVEVRKEIESFNEKVNAYTESLKSSNLVHDGNVLSLNDHMYFSGVDTAVGKLTKKDSKRDYHSFTALTLSGVQAYAYHDKQMTLVEWTGNVEQMAGRSIRHIGKVSELHSQFPGLMYLEINGPGQAAYINHIVPDDPRCSVLPRNTNFKTKEQLIRQLILAVESHAIVITDPFTFQCMSVYQRGSSPGKYGAPQGDYYDDPVISLALAWSALLNSGAVEFTWGNSTDNLTREEKAYNEIINVESRMSGFGPSIINTKDTNERASSHNPAGDLMIIEDEFDLGKIREPRF